MKRAFSVATAGALVVTIAAAVAAAPSSAPPSKRPAPAKAPAISKFRQHQLETLKVSAPGDEYFGRMKLSYLGINNEFRDDAIRAGLFTADPTIVSRVNWADEALRQWQSRYPKDPQLARSYWLGFLVYRKIYTLDAQNKAWNYLNNVASEFPNTFFGKTAKADLKTGFTEHYYANPEPCPSPTPTLMPGARTPAPTETPSPSPSPSPTPTPAPGQPKVVILPVACYTPQPSPSPTPTPTIAPSVPPSPLPSGVTPSPSATPPSGNATPEPIKTMAPAPSPSASATPHRHG